MIGLNHSSADVVVINIFVYILMSLAGNSIGLMGGSMFSDVKVASGVIPMFIMPLMLFSGFF